MRRVGSPPSPTPTRSRSRLMSSGTDNRHFDKRGRVTGANYSRKNEVLWRLHEKFRVRIRMRALTPESKYTLAIFIVRVWISKGKQSMNFKRIASIRKLYKLIMQYCISQKSKNTSSVWGRCSSLILQRLKHKNIVNENLKLKFTVGHCEAVKSQLEAMGSLGRLWRKFPNLWI